ncbi:DNA cytosine methyltransferase [Algoriphagus sp.]|uniref:DNA cytosine methyltransferase n=1 Tax=Algoriphagus sp. TaxID=1872435 RepID=UPI0032801C79
MYDSREKIRFIDLFCGIGGFRIAFEEACQENDISAKCVFSSDIDTHCQDSFEANFGERPHGDTTQVDEKDQISKYIKKKRQKSQQSKYNSSIWFNSMKNQAA